MSSLAFFSDVHGNSTALRAVLNDIGGRSVGGVFCLGDLVGYGPDPNGVIELIRERGMPAIAGNYDDGVAHERGGCGCYYPDAEARRIGEASYAFTAREVTPQNKAWLRELPAERHIALEGRRLHLVHGSPRRLNEYLLPDRDGRTFERIAALEKDVADVLVFGHTHVPWHADYGGVFFVNVGSCGRPKDGDTRASYSILTVPASGEAEVEVVRVPYDVEETAVGVRAAGLPPALAEAFRAGR